MRRVLAGVVLAIAAVVIVAAGCSSSTAPANASVTGTWFGLAGSQPLNLTLLEAGGAISGSGTLCCVPLAVTVSGVHAGSSVSLTLTSGLHPAVSITAVLSAGGINGHANGSGFAGDSVWLAKSP
jgi:hypothetical protein